MTTTNDAERWAREADVFTTAASGRAIPIHAVRGGDDDTASATLTQGERRWIEANA